MGELLDEVLDGDGIFFFVGFDSFSYDRYDKGSEGILEELYDDQTLPVDYDRAMAICKKGAELCERSNIAGSTKAGLVFSRANVLYKFGRQRQEDALIKEAIGLYRWVVESGEDLNVKGFAAYRLAICYSNGFGCEADEAEMDRWISAAEADNSFDMFLEYSICGVENSEKNFETAFQNIESLLGADRQNGATWYAYGHLCRYAPKQYGGYKKAEECFLKALEYKDSLRGEDFVLVSMRLDDLYCDLFQLYAFEDGGVGTKEGEENELLNPERAYEIAKEAAAAECERGSLLLAICFEDGIGVEKDRERARTYYQMYGDEEALARLDEEDKEAAEEAKREEERKKYEAEQRKREEFYRTIGDKLPFAPLAAVFAEYVLFINFGNHFLAFLASMVAALVGIPFIRSKYSIRGRKAVAAVVSVLAVVVGGVLTVVIR